VSTNDFNAHYDEVGVEHLNLRGSETDRVVKVEPPKLTPRWVLSLRALVRRRAHGRPQ
jgi:hypothetical protein